jgi:hypothetical protein
VGEEPPSKVKVVKVVKALKVKVVKALKVMMTYPLWVRSPRRKLR